MESRAGTGHGRGDESVWYGGSSPESEVEVFIILRDLDLGLNVSISTIFGLSSNALTEVSKDVDILLLWNSLLVSSNLSMDLLGLISGGNLFSLLRARRVLWDRTAA